MRINQSKKILKRTLAKHLKSLCSEDSDSNSEIHEINISLKTFNKRISMAADDLRFKTKCLNDVIDEIKVMNLGHYEIEFILMLQKELIVLNSAWRTF